MWASLVVQWLRIHLPMQGTRVQSRIQEDPTGCGATWPVWETTEPPGPEPELRSQRSPRDEKAELRSQSSPRDEKAELRSQNSPCDEKAELRS